MAPQQELLLHWHLKINKNWRGGRWVVRGSRGGGDEPRRPPHPAARTPPIVPHPRRGLLATPRNGAEGAERG